MPTPPRAQHWNDDPIKSSAEDVFGRAGYANRAADLIVGSHRWDSSLVFGLTGPWGSGKSSVIEMILERMKASHGSWGISRFTPWATTDVTGMLSEFYSALSEALPAGKKSDRFRKKAGVLVQIAAPAAKLIPIVGDAIADQVDALGNQLQAATPWQKQFQLASKLIQDAHRPILVIADDIDRLQADELRTLLKVIRLLGRFPGVQYLLAYDDATLFRNLRDINGAGIADGAARRFMEKIVQYPLSVPPLLDHQLLSRIILGIDGTVQAARPEGYPGVELPDIEDVLISQLPTPRAIDRFLAQLRHQMPIWEPEEINDKDVVLLTLLRVLYPEVYHSLPSHRRELLTGLSGSLFPITGGVGYVKADLHSLYDSLPDVEKLFAEKLLRTLFPAIDPDSVAIRDVRASERSIRHDEYFDRYFAMRLLENDISDERLRMASKQALDGHPEVLRSLVSVEDEAKGRLAVAKATPHIANGSPAQRLEVARMLAGVTCEMRSSGESQSRVDDRIISWIQDILIRNAREGELTEGQIIEIFNLGSPRCQFQIWEGIDAHLSAQSALSTSIEMLLAERAISGLMSNLGQRDAAPTNDVTGVWINYLRSSNQLSKLRSAITAGLTADLFGLADLAARVVGLLAHRARGPLGR